MATLFRVRLASQTQKLFMDVQYFLGATFDAPLFLSTFLAIAIAELPDKTALATVMLATGKRPFAVFLGVAAAFVIQSLVAVTCGSLLGLLPPSVVRIGSGLLFLTFAVAMWRRRDEASDVDGSTAKAEPGFWTTCWTAFMVIFIAEWGDLTQLATAALAARYTNALTIFTAATLALWAVSALAVFDMTPQQSVSSLGCTPPTSRWIPSAAGSCHHSASIWP